jgi:hypothetical protein
LIKRGFPGSAKSTSNIVLNELEACGSEIWNASTHLIRSAQAAEHHEDGPVDCARASFLFRIFAFMLLDFAFQSRPKRQKDQDRLIRNLKVGIKACKVCLDAGELDLASTAIQKCGQYAATVAEESTLVQLTSECGNGSVKTGLDDHVVQLRLLRLTHAWRVERLDLAEHFYQEFLSNYKPSAALVEDAAELLHKIGTALLSRKLVEPAEKWLQRALSALGSYNIADLSQNAFELRLAISTSLGTHCSMSNECVDADVHSQLHDPRWLSSLVAASAKYD